MKISCKQQLTKDTTKLAVNKRFSSRIGILPYSEVGWRRRERESGYVYYFSALNSI